MSLSCAQRHCSFQGWLVLWSNSCCYSEENSWVLHGFVEEVCCGVEAPFFETRKVDSPQLKCCRMGKTSSNRSHILPSSKEFGFFQFQLHQGRSKQRRLRLCSSSADLATIGHLDSICSLILEEETLNIYINYFQENEILYETHQVCFFDPWSFFQNASQEHGVHARPERRQLREKAKITSDLTTKVAQQSEDDGGLCCLVFHLAYFGVLWIVVERRMIWYMICYINSLLMYSNIEIIDQNFQGFVVP